MLLSSKAADATVKVADFGFSTECKDDEELFETLGTPPYMGMLPTTLIIVHLIYYSNLLY